MLCTTAIKGLVLRMLAVCLTSLSLRLDDANTCGLEVVNGVMAARSLLSSVGGVLRVFRHADTRLTALYPGLPGWAGTRKVKPVRILLKQETVSGSGIGWAICKSAITDNHASTLPLSFLQAGCPSCRPTNSVNASPLFTTFSVTVCTLCLENDRRVSG